jgi:hypothetical protein
MGPVAIVPGKPHSQLAAVHGGPLESLAHTRNAEWSRRPHNGCKIIAVTFKPCKTDGWHNKLPGYRTFMKEPQQEFEVNHSSQAQCTALIN